MVEPAYDKREYEAFVQGHPKGHFAQSVLWGKQKAQWDWEAVVSRDSGGAIRGSLAILFRTLPLGLGSFAYACRGPVCDPEDGETIRELCGAARALALSRRAVALRMDPDIPAENRAFAGILRAQGFRPKEGTNRDQIQPRFVYRLGLAGQTEESLLASFHPKTRYNIGLARRRGVEVRLCGAEAVPAFSALMAETGRRDGFVPRPASYFARLLQNFGDHARLYLAYYGKTPLAGAIALQYGDKTWYLYGASSGRERRRMPNYLLQWEMIRWALESGSRIYDFRGISGSFGKDAPIEGLRRFKAGFRGTLVEFLEEQDLVLSPVRYGFFRDLLSLRGQFFCRRGRF